MQPAMLRSANTVQRLTAARSSLPSRLRCLAMAPESQRPLHILGITSSLRKASCNTGAHAWGQWFAGRHQAQRQGSAYISG